MSVFLILSSSPPLLSKISRWTFISTSPLKLFSSRLLITSTLLHYNPFSQSSSYSNYRQQLIQLITSFAFKCFLHLASRPSPPFPNSSACLLACWPLLSNLLCGFLLFSLTFKCWHDPWLQLEIFLFSTYSF